MSIFLSARSGIDNYSRSKWSKWQNGSVCLQSTRKHDLLTVVDMASNVVGDIYSLTPNNDLTRRGLWRHLEIMPEIIICGFGYSRQSIMFKRKDKREWATTTTTFCEWIFMLFLEVRSVSFHFVKKIITHQYLKKVSDRGNKKAFEIYCAK